MDASDERVLTVGQLSELVGELIESEPLQHLYLQGEVVSKNVRNGHIYFDLGDPDDTSLKRAAFSCIIWRSTAARLETDFQVGDVLLVKGGLNYYAPSSKVSFVCWNLDILSSGEGKALAAKRKLLEKLDRMGLLDPARKRPLPRFVGKLAIVSSPEAAGYKDMLDTLSRRYPCEEVKLFEAQVQGAAAPDSIAQALRRAYAWGPDALIVGRGGGSKTDLSCFDDERVAMAIAESRCPVITAIGHQVDVSVADRLADVCAITPTDAAGRINPSLEELSEEVEQFRESLTAVSDRRFSRAMMEIIDLRRRLEGLMPSARLARMDTAVRSYRERLCESLRDSLENAADRLTDYRSEVLQDLDGSLARAGTRIGVYRSSLGAASVESSLRRGFALVRGESGILRAQDIEIGQRIDIQFADGRVEADVTEVEMKRGG